MVLRMIPVNIYDVVQLENYLSYMAEQGLFLKKVIQFGIFERGIEEKTKYHIEPIGEENGEADKEKLARFEEWGWEYICKIRNTFYILKAKSEDAKELFVEPDALRVAYIKAKKKSRNSFLYFLGYSLFFLASIGYFGFFYDFPIYFAINGDIILFILGWIFLGYVTIREYKNFICVRHCLKFGCDYSQKHTYPTQYGRFIATITVMFLCILISSIYLYSRFTQWEKPLTDYHGMYPGIPLATLETSPKLQLGEYEEDVKKENRTNRIQYRWTELAPEIYEIQERGKIEERKRSMVIDTKLYILRYQFLVEPFLIDSMKYKKSFYVMKDFQWQSLENTKFDQAYYGHTNNFQGFYASVGNKVICVQYYGDEELSDFGDKNLSKFSDEIYQSLIQFDYYK